jgi:Protein of unknown function (DUF2839)
MGESKRRKQALGEDYGKAEPVFPGYLSGQKNEQSSSYKLPLRVPGLV